jgi:hypothetical protein
MDNCSFCPRLLALDKTQGQGTKRAERDLAIPLYPVQDVSFTSGGTLECAAVEKLKDRKRCDCLLFFFFFFFNWHYKP